jgi:dTDP-glucose pyrophosphorylase
MKDIVAVILAAGRGTRMQPFSEYYPKPGLPICNKPLIEYTIETFRDLGIKDINIVIGHLGHELALMLGRGERWGVRLKYVEQTKLLGIAAALGQMEPHVAAPMFLVLGDIFFKTDNLTSMIAMMEEKKAGAILAVKHESDPQAIRRNFTVRRQADGRVTRVVEKPRYVDTTLKGCGLYLFDLPVFDAVRRTPRTAMRDEYEITDTIQIMIDDGLPVFADEVVQWDVNLTAPSDVLICNMYELRNRGCDTAIAPTARVHADARLKNVVIGDGAVIRNPISITNSVIFPGTDVSFATDIDRFIFTPEHQIDCRPFITEELP